jgi:hypothetical protein
MPSPSFTAFLTDDRTLKLATFVDHTDARNSDTGFRDRPFQPLRHPTTRHVIESIRRAIDFA